ncbi:hypothetical protein CEUSTIGMA_g9693.t1 [Chlamydomonas eustigma]|uniref:CS domain-containing protein n=1 Tax=Chlamydomonas eustigma TaxID=1157962 RepID=A0A250XGQ9_9CHLO|nr:hypothetical protein CEUSTIGMA_g9693.t1 [Chlamydomonas eustigma]|eukprot:GAX82265.1 hypothetical protein CEUSTIGMA_g9693.t1 [Chlamydomonas eustigma]
MPITPLFEYTQDEDGLEILVQVGGASKSKADVFATDSMIKVNCSPYLLLIDLHGVVDDSKTVVTISQEGILFRLLKTQKGLWCQLEATGEKDEILKRRNSSIDRAHERVAAVHKQRLERKQKEDREATQRQIELERKRRQEMENRKKQELEDERRQLEDWQKNISTSKTMASAADMSKVADDSDYESDGEAVPEAAAPASGSQTMPDHPDYHGKGWRASNTNHDADGGVQTWSEGRGVASKAGRAKKGAEEEGMSGDEEFDDAVKKDQAVAEDSEIKEELEVDQQSQVISFKPLPPPRMRLEPVRVDFTKLETGHLPARENREEEIRLYKKSIKNDRQLLSDSADVSDRQPAFLKDKGDALYKQGNFREATERQIELERKRRQEMENRKKQELEDERRQLEDWQKNISTSKTMASAADMSKVADDSDYESDGEAVPEAAAPASGSQTMPDHPDYHGKGWRASNTNHDADGGVQTWSEGRGVASKAGRAKKGAEEEGMSGDEEFDDAVKKDQAVAEDSEIKEELEVDQQSQVISFKPLPPPRMRLEPVRVDFTKLETGHLPARENREEEIRLYKKSIKNDRQLLSDSADVSDRQPAFLKDKGDALYKQGNFRGAINAYSRALEMDPESGPAVWSNAAACFLQLGEYEPCISNCSRALDMLVARKTRFESGDCEAGEAEKYKKQVVRALVRRGKANTALGLLQEAESDYVEALRYAAGSTDDLSIATDLEEVRAAMGPMDAAALKQRGSSRFQAQDYEGAMEAFTLLLGMPSAMVQDSERLVSFSNRAACFLVLERYDDSVRDCSEAIKLALESLKSKADEVATWWPQQAAADTAQNPVASSSTATTTTDAQSKQGSSEKAAETTVTSAGADTNSTAAATVSRDGIEIIDGVKGSLAAGGEINRRNSLLPSDELQQHPQMKSCGLERSSGSEEILVLDERSYHWSSGVLLLRTLVEEALPSSSDPQNLNAWTGKICNQKSVIVGTATPITTGQDSDSGGGIFSVTTSNTDASSMSTCQDLVEGWLAGDRAAHSKYHDSASTDAAAPSRSGGSTSYPLSAAVIFPHDLSAMRQQCHTAEAYLSSGIKQLSRLLARRGAAQGHLKCFQKGCWDYESAANLARICGDDEIRYEQLGHDAEKLRKFRYETLRKLDVSSYGAVYLCRDKHIKVDEESKDKSVVAIKLFTLANSHAQVLKSAITEATLLELCSSGHPNIVQLHQAYRRSDSGRVYLVLEYLPHVLSSSYSSIHNSHYHYYHHKVSGGFPKH